MISEILLQTSEKICRSSSREKMRKNNFVQHCFLMNLRQAHLTFMKANNKAIR